MTKPQLFMFHFAGGNCNSFRFLDSQLPNITIENPELPGRGMRSDEQLVTSFNLAAVDLYSQVKERLVSKNIILYGHSMGALFALRITQMLEAENIVPSHLIVSGSPGPGINTSERMHLLNDEEFILQLKKLGGLPSEFLENQELLDYFTPILKADFELCETNDLDKNPSVTAPIYSIMGDLEKHVNSIQNWSNYTHSSFKSEIHSGNHFFIYKSAERIGEIIKNSRNN